jgi:predicted RNase H-like nuclease (RuvC/YqgF family)
MKIEDAYAILNKNWVIEEINRLKDGLSALEKTHESLIKEHDALLSDKRNLEVEMRKIENIEPYLQEVITKRDKLRSLLQKSTMKYTETISINKYELTAILREHYGYVEGEIVNRP